MRAIPVVLIILLSLSLIPTQSALAKDGETNNGIEVLFGLGYRSAPEDDTHLTNYGLRYHHRINERWGFEITGEIQDDFVLRDDEGIFFDVSARINLFQNERLELFTLFGPGIVLYDRRDNLSIDGDVIPGFYFSGEESLTFHAGLGLDIHLSNRTYLRPDLRYRYYDAVEGLEDDESFESTIALGYRF